MGIRLDRTQFMAEVGNGNLNWEGITKACREAGTKWYIVEQDNCNGRDPFDSVADSLRNMKAMGLS
jgi:sugar phosphate isomerase/epimerase